MDSIIQAAKLIIDSKRTFAFTGAGISVESGIPSYRGENGIWNNIDEKLFDLLYYLNNSQTVWPILLDIFFNPSNRYLPNTAHHILADWEERDLLEGIVTQNIDFLHQLAGNKIVHEFHGTTNSFICTSCKRIYNTSELTLSKVPPLCNNKKCSALLKPNFIFFGEGIPSNAYQKSQESTLNTDVFIVIGTSGEVSPANQIPIMAKQNGSMIIEINTKTSLYTDEITDVFLKGKASDTLQLINKKIKTLLTK